MQQGLLSVWQAQRSRPNTRKVSFDECITFIKRLPNIFGLQLVLFLFSLSSIFYNVFSTSVLDSKKMLWLKFLFSNKISSTCRICQSEFSSSKDLKLHMNQVHGEDSQLKCSECSQTFKWVNFYTITTGLIIFIVSVLFILKGLTISNIQSEDFCQFCL